MTQSANNRFQAFFEDDTYVLLKHYLYNFRLRQCAVAKSLRQETWGLMLELGSGIAPVVTSAARIIYADLSFDALFILKRADKQRLCVVCDAVNLPFKGGVFSHVVCSEVLEHLENDCKALKAIGYVATSFGKVIVTFPHRKAFFGNDDRYVGHYRRYETDEIMAKLEAAGFKPIEVKKVLGPLEKLTMSALIFIWDAVDRNKKEKRRKPSDKSERWLVSVFKCLNVVYMGLAWLDARIMPDALSAVKLIKAQKHNPAEPEKI